MEARARAGLRPHESSENQEDLTARRRPDVDAGGRADVPTFAGERM